MLEDKNLESRSVYIDSIACNRHGENKQLIQNFTQSLSIICDWERYISAEIGVAAKAGTPIEYLHRVDIQ